jgi:hypothetical protein
VKTLTFIDPKDAGQKPGAVFESEASGRERISLYVELPHTQLESLTLLGGTYLAPGYFGTPTLGAENGVYGVPHTLSVAF